MDDLINRQAAVLALVHNQSWNSHEDQRNAIGIIADLPPAREWIPVSERLPQTTGLYLVTGKWWDKARQIWLCEFARLADVAGWFNGAENPAVDAWMPLPEPYKGEKE